MFISPASVLDRAALEKLNRDGDYLAASVCILYPVGIAIMLLAIKIRRGPTLREYLGLKPAGFSASLRWLGAGIIFLLAYLAAVIGFNRRLPPEILEAMVDSSGTPALFWLAVVAVMPLFEEPFFRGFLWQGFRRSRLGAGGTIVLTALLWTAVYFPLDWFELGAIFVLGLVLGAARWRTGSLLAPLLLHGFVSLVAMLRLLNQLP